MAKAEAMKKIKCPMPWSHQANCSHADGNGYCEAEYNQMCPTLASKMDTKMDGCQTVPNASAEYTAMCGEGQRYGRCEDY